MAHTQGHTGWTHVPYVETLTQDLTQDPRISQVIVSDTTLSLFIRNKKTPLILSSPEELESLLSGYWGELTLN